MPKVKRLKIFTIKNMAIASVCALALVAAYNHYYKKNKSAPIASAPVEQGTHTHEQPDYIEGIHYEISELNQRVNSLSTIEVPVVEQVDLSGVYRELRRMKKAIRILSKEQLKLRKANNKLRRMVKYNRHRVTTFNQMFQVVDRVPKGYKEYSIWLAR